MQAAAGGSGMAALLHHVVSPVFRGSVALSA